MEYLLISLIKITFTVGVLLAAAILFFNYYLSKKKAPQRNQVVVEEQKILLPLRLQAYERIVLYLERINPHNLIMRLNRPEMTATQFHLLLVKTIREEFEYNLSQQLYISSRAWELVKNAKEETLNLINQALSKIPETATSAELAKACFDEFLGKEKQSVDLALEEIKQEVRRSL